MKVTIRDAMRNKNNIFKAVVKTGEVAYRIGFSAPTQIPICLSDNAFATFKKEYDEMIKKGHECIDKVKNTRKFMKKKSKKQRRFGE